MKLIDSHLGIQVISQAHAWFGYHCLFSCRYHENRSIKTANRLLNNKKKLLEKRRKVELRDWDVREVGANCAKWGEIFG